MTMSSTPVSRGVEMNAPVYIDRATSTRRMLTAVALGMLAPLFVLLATYKAHTYYGLPITSLTRDPSAVANVPWHVGAVSHIGVLHWCAAAAVCVFAGLLLWQRRAGLRQIAFFASAAGLSALLMFDDLYMLHEAVGPQIFSVSEKVFLGIDAALLGLFLLVFARDILRRDWLILACAFGFFGLSIVVDQLSHRESDLMILAEDGAKLIGAAMWLTFFTATALRTLDQPAGEQA